MTALLTGENEEELRTLQHEVQRLLGRSLLRLQQYELLIKAIVGHHSFSGPVHELTRAQNARIDDSARKTLGILVDEFLGSYVVSDEIGSPKKETNGFPENCNWFAMQTQVSFPGADFVRIKDELKALVLLRNNLVHHFIDQHDLSSLHGCRSAQDTLIAAYSQIDQSLEELREWAADMGRMQRALSEIVQSEAFQDIFINEIVPHGKVDLHAAGVVRVLREAFDALAVDGWAPVAAAGNWITDHYPEHQPTKFGRQSWRQAVQDARVFELRYFKRDGKRSACYREREES